jgi:CBS domain-containing protein
MKTSYSKEKVSLVNELIYEIKIKEAMTKKVVCFNKDTTFRKIQLRLKEEKISGVPILDEKKDIIGIISIDDVITAFDKNYINENIENYMTREVITVPQNFSIISAIQKFEKYEVGRLPVTEFLHSKRIVGIITLSDISNKLLEVTQSIAGKVEKKESKNSKISSDFIKNTPKKYFKFEGNGDDFNCTGETVVLPKILHRIRN